MAQAFGMPTFPVDTHIHRLAQRWGLTRGRNVVETERDLKRAFPRALERTHLQIIYYGREYCTARGCDGRVCEICTTCYPPESTPNAATRPEHTGQHHRNSATLRGRQARTFATRQPVLLRKRDRTMPRA